jgi:type IV secretory pathway TraG/TraD family ATPase VirD4
MEQQPSDNRVLKDEHIIFILILGGGFLNYRNIIDGYLEKPFFVVFLISAGIFGLMVYLFVGHHFEKMLNKVNMWRAGIKVSEVQRPMVFPFVPFTLGARMDQFYADGHNMEKTLLGLNAEDGNKTVVSIEDMQRTKHFQLLGLTGSGKTEIFKSFVYQDALKNRPVFIIDAKGEKDTIDEINGILSSIGREKDFLLFSLTHKHLSCSYNPLYVGECDPQIIIDTFFDNFETDNAYYRETSKTIFTCAFYILYSLGKPISPMDVYTYFNDELCFRETNKRIDTMNRQGTLYLKLLSQKIEEIVKKEKGWRHVISGFNNYLLDYRDDILNEDDSDIVLTDIIRNRKIVYFQLPTNAYPIQARGIARMVQANLRYISSLIQTGQIPKDTFISIIIDEYGSFAENTFTEILNKARSSRIMATLAHQSLSDLRDISDTFMELIDDNTLNKIYLRQPSAKLCESVAKNIGTYMSEESTFRKVGGRFGNQVYSGDSSNKLVNKFHFEPDRIKNLHEYGQGYYLYKGTNSNVCVNFGMFDNIPKKGYEKKTKANKNQGLMLFEKYYINSDPVRREKVVKRKGPEKQLLEFDD